MIVKALRGLAREDHLAEVRFVAGELREVDAHAVRVLEGRVLAVGGVLRHPSQSLQRQLRVARLRLDVRRRRPALSLFRRTARRPPPCTSLIMNASPRNCLARGPSPRRCARSCSFFFLILPSRSDTRPWHFAVGGSWPAFASRDACSTLSTANKHALRLHNKRAFFVVVGRRPIMQSRWRWPRRTSSV